MESVDDYLASALAAITPLAPRELTLADAQDAVLAEPVTARYPLPPFDNSAMDGYAVRAADLTAATEERPITLPVSGEVPAGDTRAHQLAPTSAMRIMTGALIPDGADAVVPVEQTDAYPPGGDHARQTVTFRQSVQPGAAIRRAGDDAGSGDELMPAGTPIGPVQLGLLSAAGQQRVKARPQPRVTVFSTGNELVEPGADLLPGQIFESNGTMLAAAARAAGCLVRRWAPLPDDVDAVLAALTQALDDTDLLVTSGGVSMGGEHDVVKAALSRLGTVSFRKVAMQPGMPQGFGTLGPHATPIFTLPGNPVSALVSFWLFVLPAIDALQDTDRERLAHANCRLTAQARSPRGKRSFLRGMLDRKAGLVTPLVGQGSHQLASLAKADALIVVPESVTELAAGAEVEVLELPW